MSCVNKNGKEFKTLAADNNISLNTLELITHKYWIETGSEENLPSDIYIQAQLGNKQYQEKIPQVRQLWEKEYSNPKIFASYQELQKAYQEASNYFPQNAIVYYTNNKGDYVLSVKQPVEKVFDTATDFFNEDYSTTKKLDLDLNENQIYGIDKVEELFNKFNTDRTSKYLAEKVFKLAKDLGLQVSFSNDIPFEATGRYTNNNTITYRKSFLEKDANAGKKAPLLLHEVIHALTVYAISDDRINIKKNKSLKNFQTDISKIFNEVRFNKALEGERGITSVREFVAEFSNPIFRQKLQNIDANKKRSVWNRIIDAIKSFLGIHPSSTYYQRSMNALDKAFNAFDIDAYLAYNGMKPPLQQVYNEHRIDFENMSEKELKSLLKTTIKENSRLKNKNTNNEQNIKQGIQAAGETARHIYRLLNDNRGSNQENQAETSTGKSLRERRNEEAVRQQKIVLDWSKKNGKLIVEPKNYFDEIYGEGVAGSESKVWYDKAKGNAVKSISLNHYGNLQNLFNRIAIHNELFPSTAMTVTNIGTSDEGVSVIVEQPWIDSSNDLPSLQEIESYMLSQGFTHTKGIGINAEYVKDGYLISDIRPENVIKQPNGELAVIDCFAKIDENAETNSTVDGLSSLIDNMSREQIISELKKIRQEYSDYDLISDDSEEVQQRRKKNTFTFNDGIAVSTPFMLNSQQAEALNIMNDFIHSDNETTMTLSGYAGTGKTSLMEIIAKKAIIDHKPIMFCATTNKATAVLKSKISYLGFEAQTLNKTFGINVEVDTDSSYDAKNLINKLHIPDIPYGTTVIIDEASMINEENYNVINKIATDNDLKIIYVGDKAQLSPINENKVSKVFRNIDGKVIELTKVERTDDNAILKEATNIRNGKSMSMKSSFNDEGKGVAFINPKGEHKQAIIDIIKHYVQNLKKNPDYFRILAYTNKTVSEYNDYVRKQLGYIDNIPHIGEPIVGYNNWNYNWRTKTYDFINSESYKVTKVGTQKEKSFEVGNQKVIMTIIPITLEDSFGRHRSFNFMDIKNNSANRAAAEILATMKKTLWAKAKNASKAEKRKIYTQINGIDKFLFVNDNIIDSQGHYLQTKTFDFGYALTIHKSQGSTFTNVLIDDNDISIAKDNVTRNTNEYNGTWEINFEDNSITPVSDDANVTRIPENEIANTKQQLEYVAMTRATDTVTVITDKAEKEDSPLNHINNKNDIKKEKLFSEQVPSIIQQLVDHIEKTLGIKIITDEEAKKYLNQHGYNNIKEARPYNIWNNYHNKRKATKEQRDAIINEVIRKKYDSQGTDLIKIGDDLFLIDHGTNEDLFKEHANNKNEAEIPDGQGYGIRKKYTFASLKNKANLNEIVRNISADYGYSKTRILQVLQDFGLGPKHLSGFDITAAIKQGIRDNALGNATSRRNESQLGYNRSGINSRQNSPILSFFIGKNARERYRNGIKKSRPDLSDKEVEAALDFLHFLEDNKENTAFIKTAVHWIINGSITLPRDNEVANRIFKEARDRHVDIQKYPTMSKLLQSAEMQPKKKEKKIFNPEKEPAFSNQKTVKTKTGRIFKVYEVANTEKGQKAVCHALEANYSASPWCLSTFTATGEPTESAKHYWNVYDKIPRKIAFENGKPVAFSSSSSNRHPEAWWDLNDVQEQYELSDNINNSNRSFRSFEPTLDEINPNLREAQQRESEIKEEIQKAKEVNTFIKRFEVFLNNKTTVVDFLKAVQNATAFFGASDDVRTSVGNYIRALSQSHLYDFDEYPSENVLLQLAEEVSKNGLDIVTKEKIDQFIKEEKELQKSLDIEQQEDEVKYKRNQLSNILRNSDISVDEFLTTVINNIPAIHEYISILSIDIYHHFNNNDQLLLNLLGQGDDMLISLAEYAVDNGLNSLNNQAVFDIERQYPERFDFNDLNLPFFITPDGEIYGFVTPDGRMYLDKSIITPEHPIHEYTHLWDNVVIEKNPKLWKRGVQLMQQFDNGKLWNEIAQKEQYGKRWQQQGLKGEQLINMIASEVHARLVGENGAKLLDDIAKKQGQKDIVAKLKEWILEMWKTLKATFSNWTDEDINNLTLADFNHMTVRDFADAVNFEEAKPQTLLNEESSNNSTINNTDNSLVINNNIKQDNNGQEFQQRGMVQTAVSGRLKISWQERSRGNSSESQEATMGQPISDSSRGSRFGYNVEQQISQVSDAIDQKLVDKGIIATKQKVRKATSQEFHDAIVEAKKQNPYSWMVDVHEISDYDNDLCMLTEDGKSGIAITQDGDIISVFSAVSHDHRLDKLMQMAIAAGGKKLDCYYLNGVNHGLPQIYAKYGFKVDAVTPFDEQIASDEYKEWHKNNPDRKVEGVAAMSLKVADSIESYNKDNTPDIEQAPSFTTYEEMINWRDNHKVRLEGYEYFNDLYEDTTVNAAWKIPLLKELDNQLSNDNTLEQNQEIINKMNDILKANVEEDIKEISSKKEKQIQQNLDEYDKLNNQMNNLLEGHFDPNKVFSQGENVYLKDLNIKFTASEIRHLSELIGNYISDMITRLQTEKGAEKKLFPQMNFKDDTDFTQMSRQQIAETIGINNLIERTKFDLDPQNEIIDYDDTDVMIKANLVLENWDALMLLASDTFAFNEGFSINRNYNRSNFNLNTNSNQIAYDDFNGYQDEDTIQEQQGDAQEYWQIESRIIDILNSMSALVKQGLHECYILDKNGNKVLDKDWKLPLRVNPRNATNSILRWTQGSLNLEDMITKLQAKQNDNPWVRQLIERLSDRSGKETDFQSQFYSVFSKHFQLYSIVLLDEGKYTSITVNSHPALTQAMQVIEGVYKIGQLPIIAADGKINAKLLGSEKTIDSDEFNLYQAMKKLEPLNKQAYDNIERSNNIYYREITPEERKEAAKWLAKVHKAFGYNVTEDMIFDILNDENLKIMTDKLQYLVRSLSWELEAQHSNSDRSKQYQPFTYGAKNNIGGTLRNFLTPITNVLEDTAVNAFYDSGKMYQSYVTPSFMTKLMNKFKLPQEKFHEFIMSEYGNSEWFRKPITRLDIIHDGGWRNGMLEQLANDPKAREIFDFKVELNFNKHNYMKTMRPNEYALSLITEYFAEGWETKNTDVSWYRMPMQSNKPSSEFFKFYSYRDSNYKNTIIDQLYNMFLQECDRIQTVKMRNLNKSDNEFIKNFDDNGKKFNFLPFLNSYIENDANSKTHRTLLKNADSTVSSDNEILANLLQRKLEGLEETKLNSGEMATLNVLIEKAIKNYMENMVQNQLAQWENEGIIEAARSVKNIVSNNDFLNDDKVKGDRNKYVKQSLENFIWNDYLASKNILQLTVGDIAFYKDAEELQKRLSQLHAPGVRGYIHVTDYNGNPVTDGKYRTIILKDWDNFISNIIDNISEIFDRKIAAAPESQKAQMMALKESLVGKNGAYRKINVADAQGYSSPSSYRKKAFIFGKWSKHSEEIYQKLLKGEYNYTDLQTAFQPLKPFVYTHLEKNLGVDNAPIHTIHVPFQAKNSEYLLIMADAIMQGDKLKGNELSRPNLLRAIYRVMEESEKLNPTKGIDTVQFESAIKSGLQGAMNIHQFADMAGGEEAAYTFMMNQIYKENNGQRTNDYNTEVFVHETSYEDYCLQQEVPEHFKNHSQAHGSQTRMITPSDLDYYIDPNRADKDAEDNINYYEWTEPDGTKRKLKADEFRKEFEETIAENIEDSLTKLQQEFHLDSNNIKERNIALSKILQKEILSSPRYGVDLLEACSIDKKLVNLEYQKETPYKLRELNNLSTLLSKIE